MALHRGIGKWIRSVFVSKPSLNIRFSQSVIREIDELVERGEYTTRTEFINRAVIELLQREGLRPAIREELKKLMERD